MDRRSFFAAAAGALGAMPLFSPRVQAATRSAKLKITAVEIWRLTGNPDQQKAYQASEGHGTTRNHRPMPLSQLYMRILTNEKGVEGFYGTFEQNAADAAMGMAQRVVGMDPLAIETIWETLHGNAHTWSGSYMFGVSTIQNIVDVYGSCIGQPIEPDRVAASAAQLKQEGYKAQKWFTSPLGPEGGDSAFEQAVGMMRVLRQTLGENCEITIDASRRWDLPFAMKWCKAVEQYHPRWLEQPFEVPAQIAPLARLRQMTSIPIATGEHNYSRWEVNELIKADAVDVIQVDPEWGGGISELVKICNLASVYGLSCSPHNQRTIALAHLMASQPKVTCPIMEYQINIQPNLCYFEKTPRLAPKNSQIVLPDLPGFGIELDESKIVKREKTYPPA
jgi:L-rhamnonate dehydratase